MDQRLSYFSVAVVEYPANGLFQIYLAYCPSIWGGMAEGLMPASQETE